MAAKNKFMNAMKMPAIADMFSSEADRQRESGDLVTEVPLSELHPFVNHPFEVRDDEDMQKLVDSIKENGVLTNLTVRPRAEGGYEIISGHRRFHAAQLAGLDKIKVQVRDVDDDQAIIDMVDANIQREHISPMEKARAYAMKLEAIFGSGLRLLSTCSELDLQHYFDCCSFLLSLFRGLFTLLIYPFTRLSQSVRIKINNCRFVELAPISKCKIHSDSISRKLRVRFINTPIRSHVRFKVAFII